MSRHTEEYNRGFVDGAKAVQGSSCGCDCSCDCGHEDDLRMTDTSFYAPGKTFPSRVVLGQGDKKRTYISVDVLNDFIMDWPQDCDL